MKNKYISTTRQRNSSVLYKMYKKFGSCFENRVAVGNSLLIFQEFWLETII